MKRRSVLATVATSAVIGTLGIVGVTNAMAATALNPNVAPGGNFNLSIYSLQLPIGSPGAPTTISASQLQGASGYQNAAYFWTDKTDGSMTFWDPEAGVHTPNSSYARTELRENGAWASSGSNTLSAELRVVSVTSSVCVGQVHLDDSQSTKPLLELYYHHNGDIYLGLESAPTGGQTEHYITNVAVGTHFTYAINVSGSKVNLTVNGSKTSYTTPSSFNGYRNYFKAGDYNQSSSSSTSNGAKVKFYSLTISH
jgi:hypothetical protein